jgi:tRNA modification GTPase
MHLQDDTIVSLITPSGSGAVAVIRLSGNNSLAIANNIFFRKKQAALIPRKIYFGEIKTTEKTIDEVVLSYYASPASYTGEDVIEIACHASNFIVQQILQLCMQNGAAQALPGEFTMRAFRNGKMDLSQAEAVADVIASETASQHSLAMHQLKGAISTELGAMREKLITLTALIELELDFAEEDVDFANRTELENIVAELLEKLGALENSFAYGNAIKKGVPVAIIGNPNAGKSTLLNNLLKEERAIVSEIAGTTRDAIEDTIVINDILFRIIDTAGIRKSVDTIENIGIQKALQKAEEAEIIIYLADAAENYKDIIEALNNLNFASSKKIIVALNKIDSMSSCDAYDKEEAIATITKHTCIAISAKQNIGIDKLCNEMVQIVVQKNISNNSTILTNTRHLQEIKKTIASLQLVKEAMTQHLSGDLISIDLRSALQSLGNITGQIELDRDILGTIFGKFCIGK